MIFQTKDEIVVYAVEKEIEETIKRFIGLLPMNPRRNSVLENHAESSWSTKAVSNGADVVKYRI